MNKMDVTVHKGGLVSKVLLIFIINFIIFGTDYLNFFLIFVFFFLRKRTKNDYANLYVVKFIKVNDQFA